MLKLFLTLLTAFWIELTKFEGDFMLFSVLNEFFDKDYNEVWEGVLLVTL